MIKIFPLLFIFLLLPLLGQEMADRSDAPWEPEDIRPVSEVIQAKKVKRLYKNRSVVLGLIHYYQKKISIHSISRCPFKTSCSHFAEQAIRRNGLLKGTALFIDRYFFRENISAYQNYPFFETRKGRLKLNDDFYLTNRYWRP